MRGSGAAEEGGVLGRLARRPRAVLTLLLVAAAGAVLPAYLAIVRLQRDSAERVAQTMTRTSGVRIARTIVKPRLRDGRLSADAVGEVTRTLRSLPGLTGARVWDKSVRVAGSTRPQEHGRRLAPSTRVRAALRGATASALRGDLIEVTVPVGRNALELHYDYRPARAEVDRDTRSLRIILALVALVLYVLLFPLLRTSARALARVHGERHPALRRELREAMRRGELTLHYQPKVDLATGAVPSVEALLRWQSPERGTVAPGDFLPQVEETDLIHELTAHVVDLGAAQMAAWAAAGFRMTLALNVSPRTLSNPELADRLSDILQRHGVVPARAILELTETAVMEREDAERRMLDRLAACGFEISIDDFGTGRSSLDRLDRLPVDEMKIDRAFIARMEETEDVTLVSAMIRLGHELGMRVVAEGVESRRTIERLREMGCDLVQGYAISRPVPDAELRRWLRERRDRDHRVGRSLRR